MLCLDHFETNSINETNKTYFLFVNFEILLLKFNGGNCFSLMTREIGRKKQRKQSLRIHLLAKQQAQRFPLLFAVIIWCWSRAAYRHQESSGLFQAKSQLLIAP